MGFLKEKLNSIKDMFVESEEDRVKSELGNTDAYDGSKRVIRLRHIKSEAPYFSRLKGYVRGTYEYTMKRKFKMPEGMTHDEVFLLISYLAQEGEKCMDIDDYSLAGMCYVDDRLIDFGFTPVSEKDTYEPVLELYFVNGDFAYFKNSVWYDKYFTWYHHNVKENEVAELKARLCEKLNTTSEM